MTVIWVMFFYYGSGEPFPSITPYKTEAACEKAAEDYRRYACVKVLVPPRKK